MNKRSRDNLVEKVQQLRTARKKLKLELAKSKTKLTIANNFIAAKVVAPGLPRASSRSFSAPTRTWA